MGARQRSAVVRAERKPAYEGLSLFEAGFTKLRAPTEALDPHRAAILTISRIHNVLLVETHKKSWNTFAPYNSPIHFLRRSAARRRQSRRLRWRRCNGSTPCSPSSAASTECRQSSGLPSVRNRARRWLSAGSLDARGAAQAVAAQRRRRPDALLQQAVDRQPDRVLVDFGLQELVDSGLAKAASARK